MIVVSALPIMLFFSSRVNIAEPVMIKVIAMNFIFFVVQGASEEVFVRGLIFPMIVKKSRAVTAILSTGLFFAFLHLLNPGISIISVINLALGGVMFGYCVIYFDSLWQACALHSAWNFVQGNVLGFRISGFETDSLIEITSQGNDVFTGGEFGVEGSVFSLVALFLCIVWFHKGCVKKGINIFAKTIQN